jgi:Mg2+-importing ATPase
MYLAIATMIGIVFIHLFHKGLHQNIFQLILFALALGVGIVPEEFPLATTFALAQGAQKLGKNGMVAKRLSAIHDLGTVQVLCIDKTGTLTKNELSFKDVLSSDKEQALLFASLCASGWPSKGQPFINEIDKAVWSGLSEKNYEITKEYEKVFESPFETTQLKNIVIVRRGSQYLLLAKGAVEAVLALCTSENQESYSKYAVEEGKKGLRIIAIAFKEIKPQDDYTNVDLSNLHLAGIIALEDPIKETVVDVIKHAQELGVTIKIITGDAPEVTGAVAYQVGLVNSVDDVITGTVFAELDDNKKREVIDKQSAFARFTPEAKYAFVKMLQEKYEVGYLGDGINDAPALKVSNVSLVVEGSVGVAREVADIILLQKGLTVIIEGVQEGRKVFVNIIKYIKTTLSANIGIYYVVALASVFVDFLPMLPLQLLLVDLLGDSMRTAIATDNVDASEIQKPSIFSMQEITHMSLILALIGMAFYATIFILFYRIAPGVLQTNLFMACLISEILFILSIRSKKPFFKAVLPSLPLFIVLMTVAALVIGLPFVPFAEHYFGFVRPEMSHLMLIGVLEVVYFSVIEITKLIYYRINRTNNA